VVDAPGFVKGSEHVALDNLVADIAKISKQLVIVSFAVGQPLALVVSVAQEGLLALGADKVLHVPMFSKGSHNPLLDRATTSTTYGDTHFVVTSQTIEFIKLLCCVTRPSSNLTSSAGKF